MTQLNIRDSNTLGNDGPVFVLDFLTERITVRELIRSRVYQEVKDYNTRQPQYFQGLVQPTDTEQTLNGYKLRTPRRLIGRTNLKRRSPRSSPMGSSS